MNTSVLSLRDVRKLPTVALKAAMAVTGLGMAIWLTLHMIGNLTFFGGPALMNEYALKLRDTGLLWPMRIGLVAITAVHVSCAVVTARQAYRARPQAYVKAARTRVTTLAARSMRLTGLLLLGYIVYHVSLMYGVGQAAYIPGDVHHNLVSALRAPVHALLFTFATALVTLHLAHGLGSSLITLGYIARKRERLLRRSLTIWSWTVTLGFAAEALGAALA